MPGFVLHAGATVQCAHGGQAQPTMPLMRVKLLGQPIATQPPPYAIAGCANPPQPTQAGPCISATWTSAATRVKALGQPVLLQDSQSTCVPTGTPLIVAQTQTRVRGI